MLNYYISYETNNLFFELDKALVLSSSLKNVNEYRYVKEVCYFRGRELNSQSRDHEIEFSSLLFFPVM
jgi:hypothetical protein